MKISYNWLKWYVPNLPEAEKLAEVITYHLTEVESFDKLKTVDQDDWIFDINILPNRAHDLLSHQGVAKELSGQLGIKYNDPTPMYKIPESKPTKLEIKIENENCRRYMGRIVRNVKVGPSPEWVVKHLESIGQRSINNIVDATNIVMYDCGNPCHAFDMSKLSAEKIFVTDGKEVDFPVVGRDKIVAKLNKNDLVITDNDKILAIAGVKGGLDSGISESTTDIVLEVANFDPTSVRKTARRLGLLSDSAKRFENDLSPHHASYAMRELSALVMEMCPEAQFEEVVDVYPNPQKEKRIQFSTDFINKKLGSDITSEAIEKILQNYGYDYEILQQEMSSERSSDLLSSRLTAQVGQTISSNISCFRISVPALRLDLENPIDMVEEIGRIYGYEKIKETIPTLDFVPKVNETYSKILAIRNDLLAKGYREVMTYSFAGNGVIEVLASASDKNFLRTNLTDGVKKSYELNKLNAPLFGLDAKEVKIFEIGTVFSKNGEQINICFADKKEVVEMRLEEYYAKACIISERSSDLLSSRLTPQTGHTVSDMTHAFAPWSLFPFITRDISVWVPEGTDKQILKNIYKKNGTELLVREPQLLDEFTKDGRTSYAFRLVFQSYEKTLTDNDVSVITDKIFDEIKSNSNFELR